LSDQVFWRKIPRSIRHASEGILYVLQTQQNARAHLVIAALVILGGVGFRLSRQEWLVLTITIGLVWAAEAFNTALEVLVDQLSPEIHPAAKICKDVSAAGVLVAAVVSVFIGLLIFGPPLWRTVQSAAGFFSR